MIAYACEASSPSFDRGISRFGSVPAPSKKAVPKNTINFFHKRVIGNKHFVYRH